MGKADEADFTVASGASGAVVLCRCVCQGMGWVHTSHVDNRVAVKVAAHCPLFLV